MRPHDEGSWEEFDEQRRLNTAAKWGLQICFGILLALLAVRRLVSAMRAKLAALRIARLPTTATSADDREESPTVNPGPRRISRHWSRHLAAKRASFGSWDLRTNWGMMSLWLLWTAYQVVMTLIYSNPKQREGIAHMPAAFWRYAANRAGNLCFANLPILFLLVSRSSLICRVTGIAQQDLTWFHRWVGWGVVALGSVHVVFYTVWYIFLGNLWARWKDGLQHKLWFQAGFVAIFGFLALAITSCRYMRENHHQLFISMHVGCSFICLGACYLHWSPFGGWPAATFFIFTTSRGLRILSVLWNGVVSPFRKHRSEGTPASLAIRQSVGGPRAKGAFLPASLERLDERCVRVTVEFPGMWHAGDWVKLSFGDKGLGLHQWHPFSISNTPGPLPNTHGTPPSKHRSTMVQAGDDGGSISSNESTCLLAPTGSTPVNEMVFVVAAHGGLTRKLHEAAPCKASVLVEGPYSVPHDMACDTLVLVAGGTGIALVQALWEGIVKNPDSADRPRRLIVVWTVKKTANFDWIPLHQLHDATPQTLLDADDLHLHYTHAPTSEEESLALESQPRHSARLGRPVWDGLLRDAEARSRGTTFVLACGPLGLTNQITDAALDIARGGGDIRVAVELT